MKEKGREHDRLGWGEVEERADVLEDKHLGEEDLNT